MDKKIQACLLVVLFQISFSGAQTNSNDVAALNSIRLLWKNTPSNWEGSDPCGGGWVGITCNNSRVVSITLSSMGLKGQLSGDIQSLSELQALSLNSNSFTGEIPPSIGNLSKLYWLDLADNKLTGTIPVSNGSTPGLDMLIHTKHFHFGKNQLSGTIPPQLFSSEMILIHVLFDNNQLTGSIPPTLGLVKTLEVVRLDRNLLSGHVPSSLNNLTSVSELHLSNNTLTGPVPDLTGMDVLNYVDLSNNSFDATDIPQWFSTLESLTTLAMEYTQLKGQLPQAMFSAPQLQTVSLRNNRINGTLDIGLNFSNELELIDLQKNFISAFVERGGYSNQLLLQGNPVCEESGATAKYCTLPQKTTPPYSTNTISNCTPVLCPPDQKASPNCKCAYPYMGILYFRAPSFSDLGNSSYYVTLEKSLIASFQTYQLPVDSVSLSDPTKDSDNYLELDLEVFPSGSERFNQSVISKIGFMLSNQTFKPSKLFGPYFFIGSEYGAFAETSIQSESSKSVSLGVIIGAACGGFVLVLVLTLAGLYAFHQKRRAEKVIAQNKSFSSWDPSKSSSSIPQLKGARWFSYNELKKSTNNFSEANTIGSGGYGKVYKGTLPNGQLVAVKRAQQGSMQGGIEFKTEIELLSRVHHKNLVSLVGFCFDQDEQMLVYEYVPNGTLKETLSGKSGIRLDWTRRLRVALCSARGLAYLHDHADPPIIHRDIKSNNILLDERLNAKVADFGLSKSMGEEKDHLTTQVKGTMGYLDPEYYMSQQLTEKSDVYSFGVLLLELITAKKPIERGRYIVREMRITIDKTKDLYGLHELLDPAIGLGTSLKGFEKYVDLAMWCVEESGTDRPTMSEVVKEIESIMQIAGLNPNAESASTSATYGGTSGGHSRHPYGHESFDYSGGYPHAKVEPQ
ncbi:PREDICTED: probable leucine-rich repeat receptor-like protein kinase At5g49770 isoform X2 [Nelumbo nucifera]|uniref:non-specific serine/threonine protein kinase n=1 Tax=Nelumbo nucifera TaxID=4432 RepID=A0A1U7ZEW5_NELNU|nr:PREDICTED: probable leucine-rich repeat receptor-like protein kinase At5g49770 isoform X2 [Nelumbo nucifera]